MSLGPITVGRSGGNMAWLGSRHAVAEAHPGTLKASAFASAEGVDNGFVPSGYPLTKDADDLFVPFDGASLDGFLLHGRDVTHGDAVGPILWHGRIKADHLPIDLTEPTNPSAFTLVGATAAGA